MKRSDKIELRRSAIRQRLGEIADMKEVADEVAAERDSLTSEYQDSEAQLRAAVIADEDEKREIEKEPVDAKSPEDREREELRASAKAGDFVLAALTRKPVEGASAEFAAAEGSTGGIPLGLFAAPREEHRVDAATPSPSTVGVNVGTVVPAVFARSLAPRLGIAMPNVPSGTYANMSLSTSLGGAGAFAKGAAVESTAGAFTAQTSTVKRISARMSMTEEDIRLVGTERFEPIIRQNLSLILSDQLDKMVLSGTGANNQPEGILSQLTDPANPSNVINFDGFVTLLADGIDGVWAERTGDVRLVFNVDGYKKAVTSFRDATNTRGMESAESYLQRNSGGVFGSSRMPATASNIAQVLRYRSMGGGLDGVTAPVSAEMPVWANSISVEDIYSDSAKAMRHLTFHVLLGDVLLLYGENPYTRVDIKVS